MHNSAAMQALLRYPNWRPATCYGFPEQEREAIRRDYPEVDVLYNVDDGSISAWACSRFGEQAFCIVPRVQHHDNPETGAVGFYKLHGTLHDLRARALNGDTPRQAAQREHDRLERVRQEGIDKAVEALDPEWAARKVLADVGAPPITVQSQGVSSGSQHGTHAGAALHQ